MIDRVPHAKVSPVSGTASRLCNSFAAHYRLLVLVSAALASVPTAVLAGPRPSVLLIVSDDQGWGDLSCHGNEKIDTPVLDTLSRQGARFNRFFVSPVCAPTRASLLTGRYHLRTGVRWVTHGWETMRAKETTIAELFRDAGYATGCFGKWHNGAHYPNHPNGQGFDEFFGFCGGHWNMYFDAVLERNRKKVPTKGYITDVLTDAALDFIESNASRPFFCYVPYNAPHGPFQVPDKYFDKYKARGLDDKNAAVYGMCENIDDNVGRLLVKLDELELSKRTIVVFLTDNGPNGKRYNGGMRGTKGSVHEGGVRVPLFVRYPGRINEGLEVQPIAAHIDLLPTLAELCFVPVPEELKLDGRSLVPLLKGGSAWPERTIFHHRSRGGEGSTFPGAVRTERYRWVNMGRGPELYDMVQDPGQEHNVAKQHPDLVKRLGKLYRDWHADASRNIEPPRIPVGYAQAPRVELPAAECQLHGSVHFANKNGYAHDYVVGWKQPTDSVTWRLRVVDAGRYHVTVNHTAPATSVGVPLRVSVDGGSTQRPIAKAYDPAHTIRPDRYDPVGRKMQVFGPLELGAVNLPKGDVELKLQALRGTGRPILQLGSVVLQRVDR